METGFHWGSRPRAVSAHIGHSGETKPRDIAGFFSADLCEVARQEARRYYVPGYTREDLQQEALLAILESRHDPAKGPLRQFARLVARRRIITLLIASRRTHQAALNEAGWAAEDSHLTAAGAGLEARELRDRLTSIGPKQARAVVLRAAGYSWDEIAEREGVTAKTIDNRLFKARAALRRAA